MSTSTWTNKYLNTNHPNPQHCAQTWKLSNNLDQQYSQLFWFYLEKNVYRAFLAKNRELGIIYSSILSKFSVFVFKYKLNPVILWKPTLAWIQRFTDRVIFHINSWKFYPNPVKFYTSTANEARDKFYVWFRPSHNQIRLGYKAFALLPIVSILIEQ